MKCQAPGADVITIDKVTPELAAQIVKHFIIPMFDSENKKDLRKKYNEMAGIKSAASTVLGDLKLTETLSNELE